MIIVWLLISTSRLHSKKKRSLFTKTASHAFRFMEHEKVSLDVSEIDWMRVRLYWMFLLNTESF